MGENGSIVLTDLSDLVTLTFDLVGKNCQNRSFFSRDIFPPNLKEIRPIEAEIKVPVGRTDTHTHTHTHRIHSLWSVATFSQKCNFWENKKGKKARRKKGRKLRIQDE